MLVEQIWTANDYRNFNYLIACPETGEALAVDPLDHKRCLKAAKDKGWQITQILNTHEHGDHTGGNKAMVKATGASLLAHANAKDKIPGIDRGLGAGDVIKVGATVGAGGAGHARSHDESRVPAVPHGHAGALLRRYPLQRPAPATATPAATRRSFTRPFASQLARLPDETLIYPGHDYIEHNLGFTLDREPDNERAASLLEEIGPQDPDDAMVSTLALEKEINTFFRLHSPSVIARLREAFPDLADDPGPREVFLKLRELRNSW